MRPASFGQAVYHYDYLDKKGVTHRDLTLYQAARARRGGQWRLVEMRAVYHIDGQLTWFEHVLATYNSGDISYKAIRSLANYLNQPTSPLVDYLDHRSFKNGGVSICHKRRVISPDAVSYPRTGFPLVKDEVLSHIHSKTALDKKVFDQTYGEMADLVERYNQERLNGYQVAYYRNQLSLGPPSLSARIEAEIDRLTGVVEEEAEEKVVIDHRSRMARSMRSIRLGY